MLRALLIGALLSLGACSTTVRVSTQSQPEVPAGWLFVNEDGQPQTRLFVHPGGDGRLLLRLDVIRAGRAMTSRHTLGAEGQLGTPTADEVAALQAAFEEAVRRLQAGGE